MRKNAHLIRTSINKMLSTMAEKNQQFEYKMLYLRVLTTCYDLHIIKTSIFFFFPGRLNFNEHVNSNHIKKFLWLEKKMYKHQCPCKKKKKSHEFFGNNNNDIEWKWRLETKCRLPTWCFWLINANPSTLPVGHTRVIYSPCSVNSI